MSTMTETQKRALLPSAFDLDGETYELVPDEKQIYGFRFYVKRPAKTSPDGFTWVNVPPPPYSKLLGLVLDAQA